MTLCSKKGTAAVLLIMMVLIPASSTANNEAHGIWGVGVQIGMVEYGSNQNADPDFLIRALNYARELADASGCIPTDEIDSLIAAMGTTSSSRSLYPRINEYRIRLARYVIENCSCAGQGDSNQTILQRRSTDWPRSSSDYAKVSNDLVFDVGMGSNPKWGYGYASVEMAGIRKVSVDIFHAPSAYKRYDQNSFAGFVIDYHTPSGYTKRAMLSIGMFDENRNHHDYIKGVNALKSVQYIDIGKKNKYYLDLNQWAPAGWDGKIWFSVGIQNAGENNSIRAKLNL